MMKRNISLVVSALCGLFAATALGADPGKLTVDASKPGPKIGPLFYGLMTEEINHSYDGGLYAELVQNRIFQDAADPVHWSVAATGSGAGTIAIDETNPVNAKALKRSLRLDITAVDAGQKVGIADSGYWGIPVWPNTKYHASFYARASDGFTGPLTVSIESNDGSATAATASVPSVGTAWKKYEVDLSTAQVDTSTNNRFVISAGSKGSVWFSLVSLFPPTYHNRPNGNRVDLMQKLADLHPSFLRFPGGNFLEGDTIPTRFNWKTTIGPLEDRPGHMGCWSYRASDGLGLMEFLGWCEDLKMEPLLAVYGGYSLRGAHVNPGSDLEPYVQDDLDEIEYCTGSVDTTWGKRRAQDGHPAPFVIHYIEIGNEDWFDRAHTYDARFAQIFDAIKAKYPNLKCIATAPVHSRRPDLYDDHGYPSPQAMLRQVHRYDKPDPNRPKVFFGEWATQDGRPTPTMRAAICDAAWLTGLQTDCDTVVMNCYAPLLVNVNKGAWQWPTNLIGYDAANSFSSPSAYAQSMFSKAWGDTVLPTTVEAQKVDLPAPPAPQGSIGVGTWDTAAEFKDIKVTQDDKTLFASSPTAPLQGWRQIAGKWDANNGALEQTQIGTEIRATAGDGHWQNYTLSLKAQKLRGNEGFLVLFHVRGRKTYDWFNVGGWGNSAAGLEETRDGSRAALGESVPFKVDTGRWYDIRVELQGADIKCYVDDKLIVQATDTPAQPTETLFAAASREDSTGDVILKVVNTVDVAQNIQIDLQGIDNVAKQASIETLQGDSDAQNSLEAPTKIAPAQATIDDAGTSFVHEFPADSVSVIRLKTK
jgi:alpha-L-arabinofuranosidase